jgi:hypothetical protein
VIISSQTSTRVAWLSNLIFIRGRDKGPACRTALGPTQPLLFRYRGRFLIGNAAYYSPLSVAGVRNDRNCSFTILHMPFWLQTDILTLCNQVLCSWNVMAHGDVREGKWRGNWRMEWVASTLHPTAEHGVSSITTADAHTSAASSRLNWSPRRFKWTRPFLRKTKSGFCACAITFQMPSSQEGAIGSCTEPIQCAFSLTLCWSKANA